MTTQLGYLNKTICLDNNYCYNLMNWYNITDNNMKCFILMSLTNDEKYYLKDILKIESFTKLNEYSNLFSTLKSMIILSKYSKFNFIKEHYKFDGWFKYKYPTVVYKITKSIDPRFNILFHEDFKAITYIYTSYFDKKHDLKKISFKIDEDNNLFEYEDFDINKCKKLDINEFKSKKRYNYLS